MATKPIYTEAASDSQLKASVFNDNFEKISAAVASCLGRGGTSESPNSMNGVLDMNNNRIQNLSDPSNAQDAVTLNYINALSKQNVEFGFITAVREYTATASQTLFSMDISYTQGFNNISIYKNGLRLRPSEYVETSKTSFTLNVACTVGDKILVLVNQQPNTADPSGIPAGQTFLDAISAALGYSTAASASATTAQNAAIAAQDAASTVPNFPSMAGNASSYMRVNSGQTGVEYRTPTQLYNDVAGTLVDTPNAYTKQQYASVVILTNQSGAITIDANTQQDLDITAIGNITLGAPSNSTRGKTIFFTISGSSTYTLTWNSVYKASSTALPTSLTANKRMFLIFRCYDGTNWMLLGKTEEA